ncbi:MAG: type II secretion system protein N, partial [bacterium]
MARRLIVALAFTFAFAARAHAQAALPETQLPLRLVGTVVASSAEGSLAVIENSGKPAVVRTGDAIGGARVQEIRKDGVVLAQSGRLEHLAFGGIASSQEPGAGADPDSATSHAARARTSDTAARRAKLQAREVRRSAAASRARSRQATAVPASPAAEDDESASESAKQNLSNEQLLLQLSKQARYAPLLDDDGKLRGVALMDIHADSTL